MDNQPTQSKKGKKVLLLFLLVILFLILVGGAYYFLTSKKDLGKKSYIGPVDSKSKTNTTGQSNIKVNPMPTGTKPYFFTQSENDKIIFSEVLVSPVDSKTKTQSITVNVADQTAKVTNMTATVDTDTLSKTYPLALSSGTESKGSWSGSWNLSGDTYDRKLKITLTGKDSAGNTALVTVLVH